MPLPFLPAVDLGKGPTESKEGLTRSQLSYLGCVFFKATESTVDTLLQFLQRHVLIEAHVDLTEVQSVEEIISILDAGARKVFIASKQWKALETYGERVIVAASTQLDPASPAYSNGAFIPHDNLETSKVNLQKWSQAKVSPIYLSPPPSDHELFLKLAKEFSAIPIIPATKLTVENDSKSLISVPSLIGEAWTSDRTDKLVPTVVTDERGIALGLVYSNQESLAESLKTGTGVYQSRKRGLWYKGATSGDTQELVRVSLDCDQDCLKLVVRQKGRGNFPEVTMLIHYADCFQASVTYPSQHVLVSFEVSRNLRRPYFLEKFLLPKDHTQHVYFQTISYYGRK